jgi:hypothetical protein
MDWLGFVVGVISHLFAGGENAVKPAGKPARF